MSTFWPESLRVSLAEVLRDSARAELLPRFAALHTLHVEPKATPGDPDDLVTEADQALEYALSPVLERLLPGSRVLGEEACHQNPALLELLDQPEPLWVLDPLDGTRNFAAGRSTFGVMLALVKNRQTELACIYLPTADQLFFAERGAGAWLNAQPLNTSASAQETQGQLRGSIYTKLMPPALRAEWSARITPRFQLCEPVGSAAIEYTELAQGHKDFVIYYRLLPWDHAPGALLLAEAGGVLRHWDGTAYRVGDKNAVTLLARDAATWQRAHALFAAP